jgi:hypothetical protein
MLELKSSITSTIERDKLIPIEAHLNDNNLKLYRVIFDMVS